jgi:hypothetical protein
VRQSLSTSSCKAASTTRTTPLRDEGSSTYFGAIERAGVFGRRLYARALSRGVGFVKEAVIIGDGARGIRNLSDPHFSSAVQVVDMYHAKEHVSSLIEALSQMRSRASSTRRSATPYLREATLQRL